MNRICAKRRRCPLGVVAVRTLTPVVLALPRAPCCRVIRLFPLWLLEKWLPAVLSHAIAFFMTVASMIVMCLTVRLTCSGAVTLLCSKEYCRGGRLVQELSSYCTSCATCVVPPRPTFAHYDILLARRHKATFYFILVFSCFTDS